MTNKSFLQKPSTWVALAVLGGGAYFATGDSAKPSSGMSVAARKSSQSKKGEIVFTKEDETAKFDRITVPIKNAFNPVIASGSGISGADAAANAVPASYAGGDGSWVFTGSVEIDGSRQALLENRKSNDGVFLRAGQRWKSCVVKRVLADSVVLDGPSGQMTFGLVSDEPGLKMASNSFRPVQVNGGGQLRGNIGQLPGVSGGGMSFSGMPQGGGRNMGMQMGMPQGNVIQSEDGMFVVGGGE
ncbi:MAG: hypothetical protein ABL949_14715 [Fimbriimonadaceae bacterium]